MTDLRAQQHTWHEQVAPRSVALLDHALHFAIVAHGQQQRKYTGDPYIVHPVNVAMLVGEVFPDVDAIAAGYLHDVLEDTTATPYQLRDAGFGHTIVRMVMGLSDISKPSDGNRKRRKAIDRHHTAQQDDLTKTVKLADLIDNTYSIVEHDPNFAKVYMAEKKLLLPDLATGNKELLDIAQGIVERYYHEDN